MIDSSSHDIMTTMSMSDWCYNIIFDTSIWYDDNNFEIL